MFQTLPRSSVSDDFLMTMPFPGVSIDAHSRLSGGYAVSRNISSLPFTFLGPPSSPTHGGNFLSFADSPLLYSRLLPGPCAPFKVSSFPRKDLFFQDLPSSTVLCPFPWRSSFFPPICLSSPLSGCLLPTVDLQFAHSVHTDGVSLRFVLFLVLFRDSFSSEMIPFLLRHLSRASDPVPLPTP